MIKDYQSHKEELITKLAELKEQLIYVDEKYELKQSTLIQKVDNISQKIIDEEFAIALFGAFSDGKTSIISALLQKQEDDMIIDIEEATSEIQKYRFPDFEDIYFIDTPGLFGTKEKPTEINGEFINLGVETVKYISEAQMLIYTIDAENPLKDSHKPLLKWLMRDLDKLFSTIFVVNKMDNVADLTDEEDFDNRKEIAINEITKTLKSTINLKDSEIEKIKIVCIAANPYDKGLDYWLQLKHYENRSRIKILREEVNNFIENSKGELMLNAGISVIKDTVYLTVQELNELKLEILNNLKITKNQLNEIDTKIESFNKDITKSHILIIEEVLNLRADIISDLSNANGKTDLQKRLLEKIGKEGYVVETKINNIIKKYTLELKATQKELIKSIEMSVEFHQKLFNSIVSKYGKTAVSGFAQVLTKTPIKTLAESLKSLRDFFKVPFKFKPWQAIKFAKALSIIGAVIDGLLGFVEIWNDIKFKSEKTKTINDIDTFFKDFISSFSIKRYTVSYFPNCMKIKKIFRQLGELNDTLEDKANDIEKISEELNEMMKKI